MKTESKGLEQVITTDRTTHKTKMMKISILFDIREKV
jgi:hypothetical protein